MTELRIMIYGAYGYTGKLIAEAARYSHHKVTLAGRNQEKINHIATELQLPGQAFDLIDRDAVAKHLIEIDVVIHCAGPFSATAEAMMQACIKSGTHYLDITGEISVFERAQSLHSDAEAAGIVLCPGVGFDVIPTDCLAVALKAALPKATHLSLGFDSDSGLSPGTAKTSLEGLAKGNLIRQTGLLQTKPLGSITRTVDFGRGEKHAVSIPWGDVSTAYWSTQIENIEVYIPLSPSKVKHLKRLNWVRPLLNIGWLQSFLKKRIGGSIQGPEQSKRDQQQTWVWGEISNAITGERKTGYVTTANGYNLTTYGAMAVTNHIAKHGAAGGYYTPATLCGSELVEQLEGSSNIQII